jgi:hypothetical protein
MIEQAFPQNCLEKLFVFATMKVLTDCQWAIRNILLIFHCVSIFSEPSEAKVRLF